MRSASALQAGRFARSPPIQLRNVKKVFDPHVTSSLTVCAATDIIMMLAAEIMMRYTVKQLAGMSGVSVRTLHFYDEVGLLKPARVGGNGYRYYEEAQLLTLQQILFYRELGFELKRIKRVLGRRDFEKVAALRSHRKVLAEKAERMRTLIATIDQTIDHLKGRKKMKGEAMFAGFSVKAGQDRF